MKFVRGRLRLTATRNDECGQSLLETALAVPMLLILTFNIINFAYFWFNVLALSAAPRQGVEYASQGGPAIANTNGLPAASAVCNLVTENVANAIAHRSSIACGDGTVKIRVCSQAVGVNGSTHVASCSDFGTGLGSISTADPEAPLFVLQRVDVVYTVTPIIPGALFGIVLPPNLNFHRQVTMRNLYN